MKEIQILFRTEMVLANLEGRKTQTRRTNGLKEINESPDMWEFKGFMRYDTPEAIFTNRYTGVTLAVKCPYGGAGDVLWVRETWARENWQKIDFDKPLKHILYKADNPNAFSVTGWKPSIHMPKAAARIWLQNESIGVERVLDISEQDAVSEGIKILEHQYGENYFDYLNENFTCNELQSYRSLWMKINGPDSWAHNPWVWVIKYKLLSTTGKPNNL